MDCVTLGDSIATGLTKLLMCEQRAYVGASSDKIIKLAKGSYRVQCIISAGSNDPYNPALSINLHQIRRNAFCNAYVWVIPANGASHSVRQVANFYRDVTVTFVPGKDGVHPASYNELAKRIMANNFEQRPN